MINHARTLLMNVSGDGDAAGYLCYELIDPAFRAVRLPSALQRVRSVLFGIHPDKDMLAYRCRQLLGLTETTPLLEYLRSFDPRVTYDFNRQDVVGFYPVTTKSVGEHGVMATYGYPEAPDASGRMRQSFVVEVLESGTVTIDRATLPIQKTVLDFTTSDRIPLTGTGVTFSLYSTAVGQKYTVELLGTPTRDLAELADACASLGEPTQDVVFGVTAAEPYKTFRELWLRKKELPLRLGALVCALVYRSEEARGKVN